MSNSPSSHPLIAIFLLLAAGEAFGQVHPATILWAAPALLFSSLAIAWGAESAQYFIAQGFALAILAWLQTLPEFAVEAVLAWHQQTHFLLANLTGALRMLTGLGWPMIYFAAAFTHRRRTKQPLHRIELDEHHCVEVVGLLLPQLYMFFILSKGRLEVYDGVVLIAIYFAYLFFLLKMPAEEPEGIEEMEAVPRAIVTSPAARRNLLIVLCFVAGGGLVYFSADPFLESLMALAALAGIPGFVFIQWVAPFVSEFPEMASTYLWARTVTRAPMALMNMVSSNINQWTLLTAMLPILYSISRGAVSPIVFDGRQELELLMTVAQAILGMLFLINMELAWWEAAGLFVLWAVQFGISAIAPAAIEIHPWFLNVHWYIVLVYFAWAALELLRLLTGYRKPVAITGFRAVWRANF